MDSKVQALASGPWSRFPMRAVKGALGWRQALRGLEVQVRGVFLRHHPGSTQQ